MPQSTMENKIKIGMNISSIEDDMLHISNHKHLPTDGKLKNVNYTITNTITVSPGKISMKMNFIGQYKIDDTSDDTIKSNPPVFEYTGTIIFGIFGIDTTPKDGTDKVDVPTELMIDLGIVAYNTFRGIVYAKTVGTPWVTAPLPIMNKEQIGKIVNANFQPNN